MTETPLKPNAVVQGKVSSSSKSLWKKIFDTFTAGNIKDAKNYVVGDVIVPGILDMLCDGIVRGAGRLIYGEKGSPRDRKKKSGTDYSGIRRLSDGESWTNSKPKQKESIITDICDYNEVELETKADATRLLDSMCDYLDYHDIITVADMYHMAGYEGGDYTNEYWGWDSLVGAEIVRSGNAWTLSLPRVKNVRDIK